MLNRHNNISNFGFEDFRRYEAGEMTAAEMHALEKAALDDWFLQEAWDGYLEANKQLAARHLSEIKDKLLSKKDKEETKVIPLATPKRNWLRVAAAVVLVAGAAIVANNILNKKNTETFSDNSIKNTESKKAETDNTNVIADTAVALQTQTKEILPQEKRKVEEYKASGTGAATQITQQNKEYAAAPNRDDMYGSMLETGSDVSYGAAGDAGKPVLSSPAPAASANDYSDYRKRLEEENLYASKMKAESSAKTRTNKIESLNDKVAIADADKKSNIQLRGIRSLGNTSTPLYIVDGVPKDSMSVIDKTTIANVEVLKDKDATALYGARGTNGAILITTNTPSLEQETYRNQEALARLQNSRQNTFRGRVMTDNNTPAANAIIQDSRSRNIGVTDRNGYFEYKSSDSLSNAIVTYNGYERGNIMLQSDRNANITVEEPSNRAYNNRNANNNIVTGLVNTDKSVSSINKNKAIPADGWNNYKTYLAEKIKHYNDTTTAPKFGKIQLSFTVNKNGKPENIKHIGGNKSFTAIAFKLLQEGPLWITDRKKKQGRIQIEFAAY